MWESFSCELRALPTSAPVEILDFGELVFQSYFLTVADICYLLMKQKREKESSLGPFVYWLIGYIPRGPAFYRYFKIDT